MRSRNPSKLLTFRFFRVTVLLRGCGTISRPSRHQPSRLAEGATTMLDLIMGHAPDCTHVSRREFLRVGGLAALGLSLPRFLRLQHLAAATGKGPAKKNLSCILLWMQGGPSHHDTF